MPWAKAAGPLPGQFVTRRAALAVLMGVCLCVESQPESGAGEGVSGASACRVLPKSSGQLVAPACAVRGGAPPPPSVTKCMARRDGRASARAKSWAHSGAAAPSSPQSKTLKPLGCGLCCRAQSRSRAWAGVTVRPCWAPKAAGPLFRLLGVRSLAQRRRRHQRSGFPSGGPSIGGHAGQPGSSGFR